MEDKVTYNFKFNYDMYNSLMFRGVAQLGSAAGLGPVGRRFESYHPEICACSSVGLECIATNDEVGGSNPSRRVIYVKILLWWA